MTESLEKPVDVPKRSVSFLVTLVLLVMTGAGAAYYLWDKHTGQETTTQVSVPVATTANSQPILKNDRQDEQSKVIEQLNTAVQQAQINADKWQSVQQALQKEAKTTGPVVATRAAILVRLMRVTETHRPYSREMKILQTSIGNDATWQAPLTVLASYEDTGAATLQELQGSFQNHIRGVMAAERTNEASSISERVLAELSHIFTVRQLHDTGHDPVTDIEHDLQAGDLDKAIAMTGMLSDESRADLKDWLQAAEARQAIDRAIDTLLDVLVKQSTPEQTEEQAPVITPESTPQTDKAP